MDFAGHPKESIIEAKIFFFFNPAENQGQADVKLSISFIRRALSVNPPRIYQAATKVIGKVGLYLKPVVDRWTLSRSDG